MALGLPARFRSLMQSSHLFRGLLIVLIWGSGIFFWGSLTAWSRGQAINAGLHIIEREKARVSEWLNTAWNPVNVLADDKRLLAALALPGGVNSVPAMRLLYGFAYAQRNPDVYLVDTSNDSLSQTAGSMTLKEEVVARVKLMEEQVRFVVASGERNGVVYLVRRVGTPLPQKVFLLVPYALTQLNATRPEDPPLADGEALGFVLPHTSGWVWWGKGDSGFDLDRDMHDPDDKAITFKGHDSIIIAELPGVQKAWMGLRKPYLVEGLMLLPRFILLVWMLGMTALVLWEPLAPARQHLVKKVAPVVAKVGIVGRALGPIAAMATSFRAQMSKQVEAPLVNAPGDFMPRDFGNGGVEPGGKAQADSDMVGKAGQGVMSALEKGKIEAEKLAKAGEDMRQQQIERDMKEVVKRCLREGRMTLLYQPIYDSRTYMPLMHEVYARLIHPNGEVMMPGQFLPVCNKFGLTQALDAAVFKKVLDTHFEAAKDAPTIFGVNVGGTSLDGIAYLNELLSRGGHVIKHFIFEVRSQEIVRDPRALKLLKDIQKHGGLLAVDYFGGGSVMLQASKSMGFDYVKLDASRFAGDEGRAELRAMCETARSIGLPVILEKVENRDDEIFAIDAGVNFLQGYGLAGPSTQLMSTALVRTAEGEVTAAPEQEAAV